MRKYFYSFSRNRKEASKNIKNETNDGLNIRSGFYNNQKNVLSLIRLKFFESQAK